MNITGNENKNPALVAVVYLKANVPTIKAHAVNIEIIKQGITEER